MNDAGKDKLADKGIPIVPAGPGIYNTKIGITQTKENLDKPILPMEPI
jgi:hypothetical protein